MLFGIGFLHKAFVEGRIYRTSKRLTPPGENTELGDIFRKKTLSLAFLMAALGVVFLMRGIPGFDEPRWLVVLIRLVAFMLFIGNQYWCYRLDNALKTEVARRSTPFGHEGGY